MPSFSSDSDEPSSSSQKLFGRERPLHDILGGGKIADTILWRDKRLSAARLIIVIVIWLLFEVFANFRPPLIPEVILSEKLFREVAISLHAEINRFMSILHDIACGKDLKLFLLAIASTWMLPVVGSCRNSSNLLYFIFACIYTLPALYEQYEDEVDILARKGSRDIKKLYNKFDSKILVKIPRGPVREKKLR